MALGDYTKVGWSDINVQPLSSSNMQKLDEKIYELDVHLKNMNELGNAIQGEPGTTVPDISGLNEITELTTEDNYLIMYDVATSSHKKIKSGTMIDNVDLSNYLPLSGGTITGDLIIDGSIGTTSTTVVTNLNADLLDGYHSSDFVSSTELSNYLPLSGGTITGDLTIDGSFTITDSTYDDEWINMTLLNGWALYGSPYGAARYRKDAAGNVFIELMIQGGSSTTAAICTLPEGYRPDHRILDIGISSGGIAVRVDIQSDGTVNFTSGGSTTWTAYYGSFNVGGGYPTKGEKGDTGSIGANGEAGIAILWTAGTYTLKQIVSNNGMLWQCIVASTSEEPTESSTDWEQIDLLNNIQNNLLSYQLDETTRTYSSTTFADGWTTAAFNVPAGSVVRLDFAFPARTSDTTSWGGGYVEVQYQKNSEGFVSLGHSGYDMNVMATGSGEIATYANHLIQDFTEVEEAFTLQYRFRHRTYSGTLTINGSHDLATGSYAFSHIIATNLVQPKIAKGDKGDPGIGVVWTAGTYPTKAIVIHNSLTWQANIETTEEPSYTATDWDVVDFTDISNVTVSTSSPSGGVNGDLWLKV